MTDDGMLRLGSADLVIVGADDNAQGVSIAAVRRAGLVLVEHRIAYPDAGVTIRPRGDVLLIAVTRTDEHVLLMLAEIRKRTDVRVLLLAGSISDEQRILTLSLGIDHVLVTPLDERELAALLSNATRDLRAVQARHREQERHHLWRLDEERWAMIAPNLREMRLTRAEHAVIQHLFLHAGNVVPRADLVAAMNGPAGHGCGRTLDVLLSRLRRKVLDCAQLELPLRSARNAGYVFAGTVASPCRETSPREAITSVVAPAHSG